MLRGLHHPIDAGDARAWAAPGNCFPSPERRVDVVVSPTGRWDREAAVLYRAGPEVLIAADDCDGLRALAGPGRWSIAALGLAPFSVPEHLRALGAARHAACHRGPGGRQPAAGFDAWRRLRLDVTLDLRRDSPVRPTDDGLRVCLPATMTRNAFADELMDTLDVVSVEAVVASRQGRRRCRDLGLHPGRYRRATEHAVGRRTVRACADDLFFFRPGLDADALMAIVEAIVAGHLVELAQGIGMPS